MKTTTYLTRISMNRAITVLSTMLIVVGVSTQSHGALVFSTGFNGNTNRDAGTAGTAVATGTEGVAYQYVADNVNGEPDTVLEMLYPANDGSEYVGLTGTGVTGTTWTVVFDSKTTVSGFQSLLENDANDTDVFIRSSGSVDIGFGGSPSGTISDGVWHRIVLSSNAGAATLVVDGTVYAALGTTDPLEAVLGLFRDDGADNTPGSRFANFALYDHALSETEAIALGMAGSQVIGAATGGAPEPSTLVLAFLGILGLALRRRRRYAAHRLASFALMVGMMVFTANSANATLTTPDQVWQLNGDLTGEEGGGSTLTDSGFTASFTNTTIGGSPAEVLDLPALSSVQQLVVGNAVGGNGGGSRTNDWTIVMDVRFDTIAGDEHSLLRATSTSGDTDIYLTPGGGIDTSFTGNLIDDGTIAEDTWYRIAITRTATATGLTAYVDGAAGNLVDGFGTDDGDFSLSATAFDLFSDNSGETSAALVNSIAFWGEVLTPDDIASLGGPTAGGILSSTASAPEPGTFFLATMGLLGLVLRRRRRGSRAE